MLDINYLDREQVAFHVSCHHKADGNAVWKKKILFQNNPWNSIVLHESGINTALHHSWLFFHFSSLVI